MRFFAARAIVILQVLILLTGNYAFFNLLTISFCLFLIDDALFRRVWPKFARHRKRVPTEARVWSRAICGAFAALALFVGGFQIARTFGVHWPPADAVIRSLSPFQIINSYGLFAVMTTTRPEIIVEGSNDGVTWLAYEFKYKPGDVARRPAWVAPHQPRLDWQMWFAALGDYQSDPWVVRFMARLLQGSPEVLGLLGRNPFPNAPPHYIRAQLYEYSFTGPAQKKSTGAWWNRELKGVYVPTVSLRN
jgi:lipase maturation factor 1